MLNSSITGFDLEHAEVALLNWPLVRMVDGCGNAGSIRWRMREYQVQCVCEVFTPSAELLRKDWTGIV